MYCDNCREKVSAVFKINDTLFYVCKECREKILTDFNEDLVKFWLDLYSNKLNQELEIYDPS